jgi:hypothetical protein
MSQPLEVPRLRELLTHPRGGAPQVLLRLGYGPTTAATPRRPVGDLLV